MFHLSMKGLFTASLNARFCLKSTSSLNEPRAKVILKTYTKVMRYFPPTYTTDDVIGERPATFTRQIQPSTISPTQNAEDITTNFLRCGKVYEE